jgi:RNA polymerase sigma-70 factor (ECF subfamily)
MERETTILDGGRDFPETRWSLIRSARRDPQARRNALEELFAAYWMPLYFYARRRGSGVEAAKDAVQGFVVHLLEHDFLSRPDAEKGRFRAYLCTSFHNFLASEHERERAQKRGGGVRTVALDFELAENRLREAAEAADAAFEREWALGVMERSLKRLEEEFREGVRKGPFDAVRSYLQAARTSYEDCAREHGMTVPQFKAFLHRARTRFRELVRQEVAQTLADPSGSDDEISELLRALRS